MSAQKKEECITLLQLIHKKYDEYTEIEETYMKSLATYNAKVDELNEITGSIMVTPDYFITEYTKLKQEKEQITAIKTTLATKKNEISQLMRKAMEMNCNLKEMR